MQRIAIWNTAFLGDAVLTLPLIQTLKSAFPQATLDFYVRRGFGSLFTSHPALEQVYEYNKRDKSPTALWNMGKELAQRRYDLWIGAHPSARSALLAWLSGASMRIGYTGTLARTLGYTHCVDRRFDELHEVERLLELLKPLHLPNPTPKDLWPQLTLPSESLARAHAFRERIAQPLLGLHPGSVWGSKRWTPSGFAAIARRAADKGAAVLLFAGSGEEAVAEEVVQLAQLHGHPNLHNFSGALSLTELAAFLSILNCYVSNDSGPMHLAWAQHTPVTALFGPTVRALGFFPRGEQTTVFEVPLACRPCGLHGHTSCPKQHHQCMTTIDPHLVWEDVERKLWPTLH